MFDEDNKSFLMPIKKTNILFLKLFFNHMMENI